MYGRDHPDEHGLLQLPDRRGGRESGPLPRVQPPLPPLPPQHPARHRPRPAEAERHPAYQGRGADSDELQEPDPRLCGPPAPLPPGLVLPLLLLAVSRPHGAGLSPEQPAVWGLWSACHPPPPHLLQLPLGLLQLLLLPHTVRPPSHDPQCRPLPLSALLPGLSPAPRRPHSRPPEPRPPQPLRDPPGQDEARPARLQRPGRGRPPGLAD